MAKIDKLIERLKTKPVDFKWSDGVKVLRHCGYKLLKSGRTSHRTFYNKERDHVYHTYEPHPRDELKAYMVDKLLEIVDWYETKDGGNFK